MEAKPGTLGAVLYAKKPGTYVRESEWVALVRAVSGGDQLALHGLYERAHRPVFTLALRITSSRETAEEVTLDVFHDVWRRAPGYDPAAGTVLAWIMNQARSRAIDRLRREQRQKRDGARADEWLGTAELADERDVLELKQRRKALIGALSVLTPEERQAIETAYFGQHSYAQVAAKLDQPLGTVKTRIRSALHKLRQALPGERP